VKYAYYPGCYAKGTAPELDAATRAVCEALDIGLVELTAAPCCGAGDVQQIDGPLGQTLAEMTLAQAEELGLDVLTVCNVCTLTLRQAAAGVAEELKGDGGGARCAAVADPACAVDERPGEGSTVGDRPETDGVPQPGEDDGDAVVVRPGVGHLWPASSAVAVKEAKAALAEQGIRYGGGVEVTHLLWALWKQVGVTRLESLVTRRLGGLRLAPFYGCQLLRPGDLNQDDVSDDPSALEELIEACGASPVAYGSRLRCCGWPVMYSRRRAASSMASAAVRSAAAAGADAMVTPCPLCHAALEAGQSGDDVPRLPILHLPQVVGLALGLEPSRLRLDDHLVDTRPVMARLGLTFS